MPNNISASNYFAFAEVEVGANQNSGELMPDGEFIRNSENSSAMRGQSNGGVRGFASPDRGAHDKRGTRHNNHNHHNNDYNKSGASSETAHDSKKGGSSSASGEAAPPVWPPKFVIALTNKEKEEDFMAIKGSKLPQRPKKRAKFIQRTVNEYFIGVQHLGAQGTIDLLRPFDDILGWDTVFKNVAVTTNMVAGSDPDLCETMIYFIIIFLLVFNFCFRLKIGLCVK
ncbi:uncharacterized protein LOC102613558 isoform X4 [Citrus sinensis]|uniref:uncharacterized protein LOC102613558 isoform X4 n=1 Tax=Citrus sinensis TaxID=2711 RepID=UPI0003D75718|nr:uncharacterized protein LOC102613558 isoform X4 [Citrus sinensis]